MDLEMCRAALRRALEMRDPDRFGVLLATMSFSGNPELTEARLEQMAREELHRLPEEVREWWEGPCNCDGRLN